MNSEAAVNNPYPEILKFCDWFKKEYEEKGLQYVKMSLPSSNPLDPKDLDNCFGKSVFFTTLMIDWLRGQIDSGAKTAGLDHFEKVCAEVNMIEALLERGETKPPPSGLF